MDYGQGANDTGCGRNDFRNLQKRIAMEIEKDNDEKRWKKGRI